MQNTLTFFFQDFYSDTCNTNSLHTQKAMWVCYSENNEHLFKCACFNVYKYHWDAQKCMSFFVNKFWNRRVCLKIRSMWEKKRSSQKYLFSFVSQRYICWCNKKQLGQDAFIRVFVWDLRYEELSMWWKSFDRDKRCNNLSQTENR